MNTRLAIYLYNFCVYKYIQIFVRIVFLIQIYQDIRLNQIMLCQSVRNIAITKHSTIFYTNLYQDINLYHFYIIFNNIIKLTWITRSAIFTRITIITKLTKCTWITRITIFRRITKNNRIAKNLIITKFTWIIILTRIT